MRSRETEVRRALPSEAPAVARTLARAFFDDPAYLELFPAASTRIDRTTRLFETLLRVVYFAHDEVWVTGDLRACATWAPPGKWQVGLLQQLRLVSVGTVLRGRSWVGLRMFSRIERKHPKTPHHYLAFLGVDPDAQGRGLGSAVLRPVLERCDNNRGDAYLESTNAKNHAFYQRQRFVIGDTVELSSGVTASLMTRKA